MTDGPPFGGLFRLGALSMGAPSGTHSFVHQYPALWQLEIKSPLLNDDHVARAKRGEQRYTPVNPARSKCSAREKIGKHDVASFFSGSMITSMILSWKCGGKFRTRAREEWRERVDRVGEWSDESGRALTLIFAFDCTRREKKCSKRLDCETRQQKYVQKLFIIHQKEKKKKKNLSRILSRALVFPEPILLSVVSYHERK